jgi:hypothetical protein
MGFHAAILWLKDGHKVRRSEWLPGRYLQLRDGEITEVFQSKLRMLLNTIEIAEVLAEDWVKLPKGQVGQS